MLAFPKPKSVGAIINRPNAKSQLYPSSVTFGDSFSQREKAFGLCRTKGFSLWEKLSAKRTDEGAVRGCNHGKSDAKTYRQNTFPGGKVAAKRTDEGTGSLATAGILLFPCPCEPSVGWCGNPYPRRKRIATSLTLLAMTAVESACVWADVGVGPDKFGNLKIT
jgi:hypothetical protein